MWWVCAFGYLLAVWAWLRREPQICNLMNGFYPNQLRIDIVRLGVRACSNT
jgi:hypothetical protein